MSAFRGIFNFARIVVGGKDRFFVRVSLQLRCLPTFVLLHLRLIEHGCC
jgi:hypothetical protein